MKEIYFCQKILNDALLRKTISPDIAGFPTARRKLLMLTSHLVSSSCNKFELFVLTMNLL